jgi:hypothetical protein
VSSDLRPIVECLLTAHYSEGEIIEYLLGPLGIPEDQAVLAVRDAAGPAGGIGAARG